MTAAQSLAGSALPLSLHATAVSFEERGVLILGPSGSGKSSLALQLMAYGAHLISDDLVYLEADNAGVCAKRPPEVTGQLQIEARGLGVLSVKQSQAARICLIVDMGQTESVRLPLAHSVRIADYDVRQIHKVDSPAFPAMILQYLKAK